MILAYLVAALRDKHPKLAYLHVVEPRVGGVLDIPMIAGEDNDFFSRSEIVVKVVGREFSYQPVDIPERLHYALRKKKAGLSPSGGSIYPT